MLKSTANPCEDRSVARFSLKKQTEHRAQQIRVGSICGPIILKKNRAKGIRVGRYLGIYFIIMESTANPCGAQSAHFVGNHEECSESAWGTLWPDFLEMEHTKHGESVWGAICEFP